MDKQIHARIKPAVVTERGKKLNYNRLTVTVLCVRVCACVDSVPGQWTRSGWQSYSRKQLQTVPGSQLLRRYASC